jgi:hypothetical protein
MRRNIHLWQRDLDIISETARSPLLTNQIARLHNFPSRKKAAERLCPLYRAGILKRAAYFQPAMQGKPEFFYFTKAQPHRRCLPHTISVAEARVQLSEWLRRNKNYDAQFYYAGEVTLTCGLLPDATLLVQKDNQTALVFLEIDNGTEPVTSSAGYSLAGKLRSFAAAFDNHSYQQDFSWAGHVCGFRLAIAVPNGRLRHVQHIVASEGHDFVLLTTLAAYKDNLFGPIFLNHEGVRMDLLGRPATVVEELIGEQVKPPIPPASASNACEYNNIALRARDPF